VIACAMPSGRRTMQHLGVTDYLVKPITSDGLRQALHRIGRDIHDILIIDDDREIVRLFHRMLQAMPEKYRVRKAYGGLEGLELMRLQPPDAVILDLLMPDLDGLSIVQRMHATAELAHIPIIVVSARGASEAIAPSSNGSLTINKPAGFQPLELVYCIEALIDNFSPATA
jgi:DNA-binding response OmpR family regulator